MKKILLKTRATIMMFLTVLLNAAAFLFAPLINTVLWIACKILGIYVDSWWKEVPCRAVKWFKEAMIVDVKAWKFCIQNISKN